MFFVNKFYEWVNTIIPNKFPSLENDHPRIVIPFFDENNKMFAFQGRSFNSENPKYITIILNPEIDKDITIYSFRHSGAIEIFKRTGSLHKLQRAMGHSSLNVSLTYLRGLEVAELKEEDMPMV